MFIGFPIGKIRPKLWGKKSGNREILVKIVKKEFQKVSIIKMNILAKFHHERTIFDQIREHFSILPFYRALTRVSEGLLRKKAIKFEVEVLHKPNFHRICLIQ